MLGAVAAALAVSAGHTEGATVSALGKAVPPQQVLGYLPVALLFPMAILFVWWNVLQLRPWARYVAIGLACISLASSFWSCVAAQPQQGKLNLDLTPLWNMFVLWFLNRQSVKAQFVQDSLPGTS